MTGLLRVGVRGVELRLLLGEATEGHVLCCMIWMLVDIEGEESGDFR